MPHRNQMSPELRDCIQRCQECYAICKETITHCLMLGGEHASADHQRILADCAQACITCVDFMLRISKYHPEYCALCADVCKEVSTIPLISRSAGPTGTSKSGKTSLLISACW